MNFVKAVEAGTADAATSIASAAIQPSPSPPPHSAALAAMSGADAGGIIALAAIERLKSLRDLC